MQDFKYRLNNGPTLVGDAAKGTRLIQYVADRLQVNELNLTNPKLVLAVHRSDVEAGADVVMTNTWDAPVLIPTLGEDRVYALSKKGVEIARKAAGSKAYVVPVMGPVAWDKAEFEEIGTGLAEKYYRVPLSAFKEAGLDGLVLETFTWGEDLMLAYRTARDILGTDVPIIALFGKVSNGSTPSMTSIRQLMRYHKLLKMYGANSVGVGCTFYVDALKAQKRFSGEIEPPFTVSVNIVKGTWRGKEVVTVTPESLGRLVKEYERHGATFVFPCCGGNPRYISQLKAGVNPLERELKKPRPIPELKYERVPSNFERALLDGEKVLCIEPLPQKQASYEGDDPSKVLINSLLATGQKFFVNLTDCAGGLPAINPIVWASRIEKDTQFRAQNLETIVHVACSEATGDKIEGEMFTALSEGLKNLMVLGGELTYGSSAAEYSSSILEVLANRLRKKFFTAVSLDISVNDGAFERQLRLLEDKVDLCLGKHDLVKDPSNQTIVPVFTQVVYNAQVLESRYQIVKDKFGDKVRVIVGVYPLLSYEKAIEFMGTTGVKIPEHILARFEGKSPGEQRQVGLAIAKEVVETARRITDGIYLVQPREPSQKAAQTMLEILGIS